MPLEDHNDDEGKPPVGKKQCSIYPMSFSYGYTDVIVFIPIFHESASEEGSCDTDVLEMKNIEKCLF